MFRDYYELAAAHARQCCERRNAEAQREQDELLKPATGADVRKSNVSALFLRPATMPVSPMMTIAARLWSAEHRQNRS
jgi:hypothetical protein